MVRTLFDLNDLNGDNGFAIAGVDKYDFLGAAVSNAGDINGDGFDDIILGGDSEDAAGKAYVVFGGSSGFNSNFDIESLDGSNGFVIDGIDRTDYLGEAVSNAGDINNDGFEDIVVSAPFADISNDLRAVGEVYVIYGKSSGFATQFDLNSLDGSNGFIVRGLENFDLLGEALSNAGDVNNDGFDDLIIGVPSADLDDENNSEGEVYVIFGKSEGFAAEFDLNSLDGSNGFIIRGLDDFANLGEGVSNAGDVNGDGFDDVIIGAPNAGRITYTLDGNSYISSTGEAYVIFGKSEGFAAEFDLNNLDGSNGFVVRGVDREDDFGDAVSSAGDLNGDGFDDIVIGAPFAGRTIYGSFRDSGYDDESGEAYVIFGRESGFAAEFDLNSLDGSNGFLVRGISRNDRLGESVSNAGDVNGDGFDDLIIGAPYVGEYNYNKNIGNEGEAYIIFGSNEEFPSTLDLANLDSDRGFIVKGLNRNDNLGRTISNAGDIDGDGLDDLVIGVPRAGKGGTAYVIFGFQPSDSVGTEEDDTLTGGVGNDSLSGLGGSDLLEGLSGKDELFGGSGNDLIRGGTGNDTVRGEADDDELFGGNGGDRLYGNLGEDSLFGEAGNDFLAGNGGKDLLRGGQGKDILYGGAGKDTLEGGNGSDRLFGNRGNDSIYSGKGKDTLKGGAGSDTLVGGRGNDSLDGDEGSDRLIGVALESSNFGTGERDTLTGGAGSDIFVLGNQSGVFYDDGNNFSSGDADFARLRDFDPLEDTVQLFGSAEQYSLYFLPGSSDNLDAKLVYDPGVSAGSETIALLENVSADLSLNSYGFTFV